MTEKRFTVKQRQGATIYSIIDYYGELPLNEGMYYKSNAEKLCKWLNTQHELLNAFYKENEQLQEERGYFERKKCEYFNKYNKKHLENIQLKEENEQLKSTIKDVVELLSEEVDVFSDKATEHDINAYVELKELDNKDAYYMAISTKKAIKMLKGDVE